MTVKCDRHQSINAGAGARSHARSTTAARRREPLPKVDDTSGQSRANQSTDERRILLAGHVLSTTQWPASSESGFVAMMIA